MELFCIQHGTMEVAQARFDTVYLTHPDGVKDEKAIQIGFVHGWGVLTEHGYDLDWCCFEQGWATCPPPQDPYIDESFESYDDYADWMNEYFQEPSPEEFEIMNANANILLADLGVE